MSIFQLVNFWKFSNFPNYSIIVEIFGMFQIGNFLNFPDWTFFEFPKFYCKNNKLSEFFQFAKLSKFQKMAKFGIVRASDFLQFTLLAILAIFILALWYKFINFDALSPQFSFPIVATLVSSAVLHLKIR